jgi:AraC-like DNA-binding protein
VGPRVRTAALTGYAGLARSLGLDPVELLGEVGLDIADLEVPDRWVLATRVARLLELSAQESGCADFGLRLASLRKLGSLGPISVVLRDEPDLRSAIHLLIRYERAFNEALHLRLGETSGLATLEVWLEFEEPTPRDVSIDLVMGALVGVVRALVGDDWDPLMPTFSRPAPPDPEPYRRALGPGVRFDGEFTGLLLPARELDTPLITADASLRPYTRQFLQILDVPRERTVSDQVAEVVELLLPLGRCSLAQVSQHLGILPRPLQRSLADEGQTFSSIVHATRAREAERYLYSEGYSLTEVSQLLGFEAPSAFSRWFRQHFGISAIQWRRAARSLPARRHEPA